MGIFRAFRLTEGKSLQFRAESTNALNLVNLANPGTSVSSPSTLGKITHRCADAPGSNGPEIGLLENCSTQLLERQVKRKEG